VSIPGTTIKFSLIGHALGGEEFVTSFWMAGEGISTTPLANAAASTVKDAFVTHLMTFTKGWLATSSGWDQVRAYCYPGGGPHAFVIGYSDIAGGAGTSGTGSMMEQCCVVSTLNTGFAGRNQRGRMYWPANNIALNLHQWATGSADQLAEGLAAMFTDLNQNAGLGKVAVVSQLGAGAYTYVTQIRVDTKPDIQRRRSLSLSAAGISTVDVDL